MKRSMGFSMTAAVVCTLVAMLRQVHADIVIPPGGVMFDFDTNVDAEGTGCAPDDWNFFRNPTVDFGATTSGFLPHDGHIAFQHAEWTECDFFLNGCDFMGTGVGIGPFPGGQPLCPPEGSGVGDIRMDLNMGTGVEIDLALLLVDGSSPPLTRGTEGVRIQFQLIESNGLYCEPTASVCPPGTSQPGDDFDPVAVTPRDVPGRPYVDRAIPLSTNGWYTYAFPFAGFDNGFDSDAVASPGGFDVGNIRGIRIIWRRPPGAGGGPSPVVNGNIIYFDEVKMVNTVFTPWADDNGDQDVDLADYAKLQLCIGADLEAKPECAALDANYDNAIDKEDVQGFIDCVLGPGQTTDYFPWCY